MIWDTESERYYIKLKPKSKTKIYINDARSKKTFKPSSKYLNALEDLIKKRNATNDKKVFSFINDKTITHPAVNVLLTKYRFTETEKFNKLYNASINFIKNWKSKMFFFS